MILLLALLQAPPVEPSAASARSELRLELDTELGFPSGLPSGRDPFDAVAADHDADGDLDLLINWHTLGPLELLENTGGRFRPVPVRGARRHGLDENPGVVSLYAKGAPLVAEIRKEGEPGVYVWHDVDRAGYWNCLLVADAPGRALELSWSANAKIVEVGGLAPAEWRRAEPDRIVIRPAGRWRERHFGVQVDGLAVQAVIEQTAGEPLPFRVGADRNESAGPRLSLWKADPHGMAWVDVSGDPRPELYVTRGTLRGTLAPPRDPKADRFFTRGAEAWRYQLEPELLSRDYARGRQVEWVDIDGDARAELYVGNRATPNAFYFPEPETGDFVDRASELGVAHLECERFAWLDVDLDGDDDLVYVTAEGARWSRNDKDSFVDLPGGELGLTLEMAPSDTRELFDRLSVHVVDVDADGQLDLWVSGVGAELRHRVFVRDGDGFRDATEDLGLDEVTGAWNLLRADLDGDGRCDAVQLGDSPSLLANGRDGFLQIALEAPPSRVGAVGDFDGDGGDDAVLVGTGRQLWRNPTTPAGRRFEVVLRGREGPALGAVAWIRTGGGDRLAAQRYGSAANTGYSQAVPPLVFFVPPDGEAARLAVLWPGADEPELHPIDASVTRVELTR